MLIVQETELCQSMTNLKIYINNPRESWVTDRFRKEWYTYNKNTTRLIESSSLVWLIAPWVWQKISKKSLKAKKVICTIHHIDYSKFDKLERSKFNERDKYIDAYHVPSLHTLNQLENVTDKKIYEIPFWVNPNNFFHIQDQQTLRNKFKISNNDYVVGSFQRDTEGYDLKSPKLSKGPDILIRNLIELKKINKNLLVLLAGYRRQYVINELESNDIRYNYFEKPNLKTINELYNCLDLYIVSSRVEGGPAAIIECATNKTPIISSDVGTANQILHHKSIYTESTFLNAKPDTEFAYKKSLQFHLQTGMIKFNNMFLEAHEN